MGEAGAAEVMMAAGGTYNDSTVTTGTVSRTYLNPEYDIRLRKETIGLIGQLDPLPENALAILMSRLNYLSRDNYQYIYWYGWSGEEQVLGQAIAIENSLGDLGEPSDEVVGALLNLAAHEDEGVRVAAVQALMQLRQKIMD